MEPEVQRMVAEDVTPAKALPVGGTTGLYRLSMGRLLVALILLLASAPFVMDFRFGQFLESALLTLVLLTAVLAVGNRRRILLVAIVLVVPALAADWLAQVRPNPALYLFSVAAGIVFVGFVILQLLRFILGAPRVTAEVLYAAIATYLMMGLLWSFAYTIVARLVPRAFVFTLNPDAGRTLEGFESLYFSFTTLCTVGYGDIVPVANVARMLAMLESISGTFYVAVLIARLVAMYTRSPTSTES